MFPTFVSKYLFFILSFFVGSALYAQSTATIYGKILGEDNDPVEDVSISILGGTQAPAYSNAKGEYSYKIPADAELTIVFYSISHFQEQRVVKLAPNEKLEINRILKFKNQITTVEVTDENRYQTTSRIDPINISHIPTPARILMRSYLPCRAFPTGMS